MKKILPILLIVIVIIVLGFVFGRGLLQKKESSGVTNPTTLKPKVENLNQLPLEKRPYVVIDPKSETRPSDYGHWITVTIDKASAYKSVEYDVEYQAGNLIQGFMHRIDFTKESLPVSKEGFFGSESKGKYKYDENVKSGSILFQFFKDSTNYDALKTYFNLQNMTEQKGIFTSNDGKATLDVGPTGLTSSDYVVIASTLGLPASITGKALSEPYGFYNGKPVTKLINAQISIRGSEDLSKARILGWDGNKWQEYKITTNDGLATAKITQLGTYILVSE